MLKVCQDTSLNASTTSLLPGITTEFEVELGRSRFTVHGSFRTAFGDISRWTPARISLNGDYVLIVTDREIEEFRPNRLSWRDSSEFLISGLNRQFRPSRGVLRFRTESEAKQAASAIIALGRATEQLASQPSDETPAEIRATVLQGPLFLGFVGMILVLFSEIFIGWIIVRWILSIAFVFLFGVFFSRIANNQLKAGPATAWFRPRAVKAWLSVDEDDLVVRTLSRIEGYRPSKIEWIDSKSFSVTEGKTRFQLIFQGPDDALKIASMIKKNFP